MARRVTKGGAEDPDLSVEGEDGADEAARAFEALRKAIESQGRATVKEMATLRKGIEGVFDQFELAGKPVDHSTDLGKIMTHLAAVVQHLKGIEASPLLKMTPEDHARAMARAGEDLVRSTTQGFEQKLSRLGDVAARLEQIHEGARSRIDQNLMLALAGGAGIVLGMILLLFLPGVLPLDANSYVAAAIMGKDRWDAGSAIMQATDPGSWGDIVADSQLGKDNAAVLKKCRLVAQKTERDQRCQITVPNPKK